ncbi:MAG: hypothetical protein ABIQ40_11610 [Bacteroidia bacterium]
MKPSPDLFQLIKSMTMSEKRHFKLYSAGHVGGESKNYLRLFDAICRQEKYDEDKIRCNLKGTSVVRHLHVEKNYLYAHLLESLNAFNREKTFLARHSNYLISIELLLNRGLFSQCQKIIRKAKKEAYLGEKFSTLLFLLRSEMLIFINKEDDKSLNAGLQEEIRILEMMKTQTLLMQLAFNVQIQIEKGEVAELFLQETLKNLKAKFPPRQEKRSFWINYYYQSALGLVSTVQNKHQRRYECYKEIKLIMDKAPQFIKDLPAIYHSNSNNLVNVMCFLGKYDETKSIVARQKAFLDEYRMRRPALSKIIFLNTSETELFLHYKTKQFAAGALHVKAIEPLLKKMDLNFSPFLFDLLYMMAVSELMVNNFKGALKWLNQVLNAEREIKFRKELQINARLLYLVVLFESHDILFENRLNSTKRFIAQDMQFSTALFTLEGIRILADAKWIKKNPGGLLKHVTRIRKESRRSKEEALNKQFDFAEWLEKKMENDQQ